MRDYNLSVRCFVPTPTHRVVNGVLEAREPCLVIDDRMRPHFFIRASDRQPAQAITGAAVLEDGGLRTFTGEPVVRITVGVPAEVPPLRQRLDAMGIECFEADVR